ncbi:MAG: hypothetical protein R2742_12905 [Micropruina glycogenica]
MFGDFLAYLRTGDLPGWIERRCRNGWRLRSVANRAAAVLAFYTWAAAALNITQPSPNALLTLNPAAPQLSADADWGRARHGSTCAGVLLTGAEQVAHSLLTPGQY